MNKKLPGILLFVLIGAWEVSNAHHSRANFLLDETITFEGTITDYSWKNPHVFLEVSIEGNEQPWLVEAHSLTGLKRMGWTADTFRPGDKVVITGNPDRDPGRQFVLLDNIINDSGETFYSFRRPEDRGAEPATRDIVSPSTDFSGTWTRVSTLRQALVGGFVPPEDWPVTELGQEKIDAFALADNPAYDCIDLGVPRIALSPYLIRWTRHPDRIEIEKEHSGLGRTIYLDPEINLDDIAPNPVGRSRGRLTGEQSLLIETDHITGARWGLATGLDSSDQLEVTETYMLTDGGRAMEVSYTLVDPVYLAEPVTVTGRYRKVADTELTPFECDIETARRHLAGE